jgi:hypothetical protein
MSETTSDARAISRAINEGWIARGFMLGIGFWLAGVFIVAASAVLVFVAGAALSGLGTSTASIPSTSTAESTLPPAPVDKRDWREQLRASDAAAQGAKRRLESLGKSRSREAQ